MLNNVAMTVASIGLALMLVQPGAAQDAPGNLVLQLNNAQTVENACQLTFVAQNDTGSDIEASIFNMVIVDSTGQVVALTNFEFGSFPQGRPKAQQFALEGQTCESLSAIAINDFVTCREGGSDVSTICETRMDASSRTGIQFPWAL